MDKSTLRFYTAQNNINGNSLGFIDFTFPGNHEFGCLINNTSKTGIFYVQNTTTTVRNFYFLDNKGALTYAAVGVSKGNFVECVFSSRKENLGIGFGNTENCVFGDKEATAYPMSLLRSAYCQAVLFEGTREPSGNWGKVGFGLFILGVAIGLGWGGYSLWRSNLHKRKKMALDGIYVDRTKQVVY
jgi:hypothetical protein